jgi:hypothetical protein
MIIASREGSAKQLRWTSLFAALAALTRNDGFVLFLIVIGSSVVLLRGKVSLRTLVPSLVIPFVVGVGGYIALAGFARGDLNLGIARRAYDAFEQGQGVIYHDRYEGRNPYTEGYVEARRLYGNPEENRFSIFRAIWRNPQAFLKRTMRALTQLPAQVTIAYGRGLRGLGVILILLAIRGAASLRSGDAKRSLFLLVAWAAGLAPYSLTFFREGYFLMIFYVVFLLASAGISALATSCRNTAERIVWSVVLTVVLIYGGLVGNELILWPVVVFLIGLWAVFFLSDSGLWGEKREGGELAPSLLILLLLSVHMQFAKATSATTPKLLTRPAFTKLGMSPGEQASLFLSSNLPEGSNVASYSPAPVYLAKMTWFPLHSGVSVLRSSEDVAAWLDWWEIDAIYVEREFKQLEPRLSDAINQLVGTKLDVVFEDDVEMMRVLVCRHDS